MKGILCIIFVFLLSTGGLIGCAADEKATQLKVTASIETTSSPELTEQPKEYLYEIPGRFLTDDEIDDEIDTIMGFMSLADKSFQMVQAKRELAFPKYIEQYGIGSVLSGGGSSPGDSSIEAWQRHIIQLQESALNRAVQIPIIYGIDAVHGNDHVLGSVIFPHNIGLGAANDEDLTREMGRLVAEQMKITMVNWNFAPCVAVCLDPRWGRTYESISSDEELVTGLQLAYLEGLQGAGIVGAAKHFLGDGGTLFGTGDNNYLIDRGDVQMTEEEIREKFLPSYSALVDAGVYTIMVSYSSIDGVKMHENKYWITDVLKGELGFRGMVVSDWEGIKEIEETGYEKKIIKAVNSGIDMLMEPNNWKLAAYAITAAVKNGDIAIERVDDAVHRILWVKFKAGLFENPYPETDFIIGDDATKSVAAELVEKSAVLLKNDNDVLPIKDGTTILVIGPAMDNIGIQCGGWTIKWQGAMDGNDKITAGTTLLDGLEALAIDKDITILTDIALVEQADIIILAIGEIPYAEGSGDSNTLSLTGTKGLKGNKDALKFAFESGKPVVTVIIAGRNVMIDEYIGDWDAAVMAYLPGTEGQGMANVLFGDAPFTGKLPMPWYIVVEDIDKDSLDYLFELGFGLETE